MGKVFVKKLLTVSLAAAAVIGVGALVPCVTGGESIGITAEAASTGFSYKNNGDGTATITKYSGSDTEVVIPSEINGLKVTTLGSMLFYRKYDIKSISVPDTVTTLERGVFYYCTGLTEINLPDTVTSIANEFMTGCEGVKTFKIPSGLTVISDSMFYNCDGLESIEVPATITRIEHMGFYSCSNLKDVKLPDTLKYIGPDAFMGDTSIEHITIPESVEEIGIAAFYSCMKLKSVKVPSKITELPLKAFYNCVELEEVELPDGLTTIGETCFEDCLKLKKINFPKNLQTIGDFAFCRCEALESAEIPDSVKELPIGIFSGCKSMVSVKLPAGITEIPEDFIAGSEALKEYTVPDTVTKIGEYAFSWCPSLENVVIPDSVTAMGKRVFENCPSLKSLYIPASVTDIGDLECGYKFGEVTSEDPLRIAYNYIDGFVLYGKKNSAAEAYAKKNLLPFCDISNKGKTMNLSVVSATSVPQNTNVSVRGCATGGTGDYKFTFYYKKSTSKAWTTIGEFYGKTREVTFVPATVADYQVKVNAKDSSGKILTKIFTIKVTKPTKKDLINTSFISNTVVGKGTAVKITGLAEGGSGEYRYAFYYKKKSSKAFTLIGLDYEENVKDATFTPAMAGEYDVRVNVMDSNGVVVTKQFTIVSEKNASFFNNSYVSTTSPLYGSNVFITGSAEGGTAPYSYAFYYRKASSTSWTKLAADAEYPEGATFVPAMKGTYYVKVVITDAAGQTRDCVISINSTDQIEYVEYR